MKKSVIILIILIILAIWGVLFFYSVEKKSLEVINNFKDCKEHGYPIMESDPPQCKTPDGRNFFEEISEPATGHPLIEVENPKPGSQITNPLTINGKARGNWYFEASFPVKLFDSEGNEVPLDPSYIMTDENWMTTDFVPFNATLKFIAPATETGLLVLYKDNPSGLPENDDKFEIPVKFEKTTVAQKQCKPTGCSRQVCSDEEVVTTCEFLPEYSCYPLALCEKQADGECGWTETEEFKSCLLSI